MALTLEKRAQAHTIREEIFLILKYIDGVISTTTVDTYEDSKVRITYEKLVGFETQVVIKVPASSSSSGSSSTSGSASEVLVFSMDKDTIKTFRHTARWVTYVDDLAQEAQDIEDAINAGIVDQFSTINDAAVFPDLTPSAFNPTLNTAAEEEFEVPDSEPVSVLTANPTPPVPLPPAPNIEDAVVPKIVPNSSATKR